MTAGLHLSHTRARAQRLSVNRSPARDRYPVCVACPITQHDRTRGPPWRSLGTCRRRSSTRRGGGAGTQHPCLCTPRGDGHALVPRRGDGRARVPRCDRKHEACNCKVGCTTAKLFYRGLGQTAYQPKHAQVRPLLRMGWRCCIPCHLCQSTG